MNSALAIALAATGCAEILGLERPNEEGGPDDPSSVRLASLEVSEGALVPPFEPGVVSYRLDVGLATADLTLTAATESASATANIGETPLAEPTSVALALGDNKIEIVVRNGNAERTYTIESSRGGGLALDAYAKASNADADDSFGVVAISGDTLAVGAPNEDSSGDPTDNSSSNAGAVYVFVRSGGTWVQEAYIKPDLASAAMTFGTAVSIDGDTLAVGAPTAGGGAAGAAYVFFRQSGTWSQQASLQASNIDGQDRFGSSVAVSGETLAVGAPREDSGAAGVDGDQINNDVINAGAVYVFGRSGTAWNQEAYVKASSPGVNDLFGNAVALDGDTLVVGAEFEDSDSTNIGGEQTNDNATESGAVFVFVRDTGVWAAGLRQRPSDRSGRSLWSSAGDLGRVARDRRAR